MKKNLFLIVIILTTKVFSQNINMNIGATKSKNYYQEITFEFIKNKIIIPVEIDGKTYKFLLDTGAPNMISKEIHDLIKPKFLNSIPITDANGKKENMNVVSVEKLNIGAITFENISTLSYDFNSSILKCFKIDGFIGSNMLRNTIIQINLDQKKIILTDDLKRVTVSKKDSNKMQLLGKQSSPYLWINLKGEKNGKEQVLIDTGMSGLYDVSYKNYKLFEKASIFNIIGESEGASSMGLFGEVASKKHLRLQLPKLKINQFEIENYLTITTNDSNSRIGSDLLKHGIMTLDFINKMFYFVPKTKNIVLENHEFDFNRTIKNEQLIVGLVWDKELKNKINYGDEILEINNAKIDICNILVSETIFKTNDSIKLKIKPINGEIFEIKLAKKLIKSISKSK